VVKSTAGSLGARKNFQVEVGPQEKVARAEVKRMKGGPQKEVAEVAIAELVEVGAGDEVAATHQSPHADPSVQFSWGHQVYVPHQSPYQSSKVHRTSSYESLTTPVRPGAARKTVTADTRCLFTGGLSVTEMRERAQVYTLHTHIHTYTHVHTLDLCMSCTYDIQTH